MIDSETGWYAVPATVKAVVLSPDHRLLLAKNRRGQWELPGGWPTPEDHSISDVLHREILEESGIDVAVGRVLHAALEVVENRQILMVIHLCFADTLRLEPSNEHTELIWAEPGHSVEFRAYREAISTALTGLPKAL
jgi:8-oxo-dGTP diphosphatase